MATILHRGDEMFSGVRQVDFSAPFERYVSTVKEVDKFVAEYKINQQREIDKLMDVETENLIFNQYRDKVSDELDKMTKYITNILASNDGILSMHAKREIRKMREKLDAEIANMQRKSAEYINNVQAYSQTPYAFSSKFLKEAEEFRKDPIGKEPPRLKPAPGDITLMTASILNKTNPYEESYVGDDKGASVYVSARRGLENPDQKRKRLEDLVDNNPQIRYAVEEKFNPDGELEYEQVKKIFVDNYMWLTDEYEIAKPGRSSSRSVPGGVNVTSLFTVNPSSGEVTFQKNFNITVYDEKLKGEQNAKVRSIVPDDDKVKVIYDINMLDMSRGASTAEAAKVQFSTNNVAYSKADGKWHPVIKTSKTKVTTWNEAASIMQQAKAFNRQNHLTVGEYNRWYNMFRKMWENNTVKKEDEQNQGGTGNKMKLGLKQ